MRKYVLVMELRDGTLVEEGELNASLRRQQRIRDREERDGTPDRERTVFGALDVARRFAVPLTVWRAYRFHNNRAQGWRNRILFYTTEVM